MHAGIGSSTPHDSAQDKRVKIMMEFSVVRHKSPRLVES
uniref:Uncharacterized protein n=1 Tax=Anguilla anguilla TaxID=7936 RepID=A0A0E9QJQ9_ANGAN